MSNPAIQERIGQIATQAARDNGVEFVHAEFAGSKRNLTVRIFIDKDGGVTIEDCSEVSRAMEAVLDADDFIPGKYVLEVSSPGLERELYSLRDFEKFTGHLAKIKMKAGFDGATNFNGRITGVEDGVVSFEDRSAGTVQFPYDSVAKANLKVDLLEEFKKHRASRSPEEKS